MALTPLRWAAIALAGMLCVSIFFLSEGRDYQPTEEELLVSRLTGRASYHGRRVQVFLRQYRTVQLTDSLRRTLPATELPLRVIVPANVHPQIRSVIDSTVALGRVKLTGPVRTPIDVITVVDTTAVNGYAAWAMYSIAPYYVLPTRPTDRCLVVLPLGKELNVHQVGRTMLTEDGGRQIFGPCAYYAAFGMPGAPVREWLRQRGVQLALGGSWTENTASLPGREAYDRNASEDPYYPSPPPSFFLYSTRGVSCMVGDLDECEAAVLDRNLQSGQILVGSAVSLGFTLGPISRRTGSDFGGRETELLADMMRSLGRERFAQFWTSSQPVPVAFQQASGMRLGDWVSSWASAPGDKIDHGPTIPAGSLISGLGVALGCVLWAVFMARRRVFA